MSEPLRVPWASIALDCDWPAEPGPTVLRGAICAALDRLAGGPRRAHVDWHGHAEGGQLRQQPSPVSYRTEGGPRVHLHGERVAERVAELLQVGALELGLEGVVEVREIVVESGEALQRVSANRWSRFRTVSPIFPPEIAGLEMPPDGPFRGAWAARLVSRSLATHTGGAPVVQVLDLATRAVRWRRAGRLVDVDACGVHVEFVTDAQVVPGLGIGAHTAEGFGELRLVESYRGA